jgi:hypothetical protein
MSIYILHLSLIELFKTTITTVIQCNYECCLFFATFNNFRVELIELHIIYFINIKRDWYQVLASKNFTVTIDVQLIRNIV